MPFDILSVSFVFIFGTIIGSFLNICIYRIPKNLSIVSPGSSCPSCSHAIPFYYNVPIISYLMLKGRCKYCGTKIFFRYFYSAHINWYSPAHINWDVGLQKIPAGNHFFILKIFVSFEKIPHMIKFNWEKDVMINLIVYICDANWNIYPGFQSIKLEKIYIHGHLKII